MRGIKADLDALMERNPNFVEIASKAVFRQIEVENVADPLPKVHAFKILKKGAHHRRRTLMARRKQIRIGLPRVLNLYAYAPFFIGYFTSLGISARNLVFSNYTDQDLYKLGAKRGSKIGRASCRERV